MPFLGQLRKKHPHIEMTLFASAGCIHLLFQGNEPLDLLVDAVKAKFPTFFYGEGAIEEVLQQECIQRKKTVAFAESCSGGALAAKVTSVPGSSAYFLGSIVAYSNSWKERFLQVSRSTLKNHGAVSRETVIEMAKGLLQETEADFAVAVSGIAGPGGGTADKPVGTVYVAIGEKGGKIDAGLISAPQERKIAIDLTVHLTLGALWRRLVHQTFTFS